MLPGFPESVTASKILAVTGSGISVASGIPAFRGKSGLWRNFDPKTLATRTAFQNDPAFVWEWYLERRENIRAAQPNAAHYALAELASRIPKF